MIMYYMKLMLFVVAWNVCCRLQSSGNLCSDSVSEPPSLLDPIAMCVHALSCADPCWECSFAEAVCNHLEPLCAKEVEKGWPSVHLWEHFPVIVITISRYIYIYIFYLYLIFILHCTSYHIIYYLIFRYHLQVVEKYGRFPHRNEIHNRVTTPVEAKFLENPAFRFDLPLVYNEDGTCKFEENDDFKNRQKQSEENE